MTDFEKWKQFLEDQGITYYIKDEDIYIGGDIYMLFGSEKKPDYKGKTSIDGYGGFYTHIKFYKNGKIKSIGAWE
jgi:hypothetical protein